MEKKIVKKELCDCLKIANWCYSPGYGDGSSPYVCDDCVNRGCSCNTHSIDEEYRDLPGDTEIEGIDWEWLKVGDEEIDFEIKEPKTYWWHLDEKQRPYPCCEYTYEENGFHTEEYEKFLEVECKRIGYDILSDEKERKWFDEFGHIVWTNDLIEKIEKIIEEYNNNNLK